MQEKSTKQAEFEQSSLIHTRPIYQGRIISLRNDTLELKHHKSKSWDIVVHPGAVSILPVTSKEELILIKQWRRAAKQVLIELPAGTLESKETPLECAKRELQEETGFKAETFIPLGGFFSSPGFCTEYLHFFIAKNLQPSTMLPDDDEAIDLVQVTLDEAMKMIDKEMIIDAKTIAGILRYERWRLTK